MKRINWQVVLAGLAGFGLFLTTAGPAAAQFATGFEASDGYIASTGGTALTGQQGWYIPSGSDNLLVFTYTANQLGVGANPDPNAGDEFAAAENAGNGNFPRGQHDVNFGGSNTWTVSYDVYVSHDVNFPGKDNISSFSLQDSNTAAYFIQLNYWHHQSLATSNGRWNAGLEVFDVNGNGPLLGIVKGKPARELLQNHWYNISITWDFGSNQITSITYTNLKKGLSGTANPTIFYLAGGSSGGLPLPTAIRFFVGGGTGTAAGNIAAFDNLSVTPAGTGPAAAQGAPLQVELRPLPQRIANAVSN